MRRDEGAETQVDLRQTLRVLRKRWLTIALLALVGGGAAYGLARSATPVYQARAQLFVSAADSSGGVSSLYQASLFTQERVSSYAAIATTPSVLGPVITQLHLSTTPTALAKQISATSPVNTVLVNVSVNSTDPVQAASIANAVATQFATEVGQLETPAGGGEPPVKVTVVQPAVVPTSPVSPRIKVDTALGLVTGLALGITVAMARELADTSVKRVEDTARLSGAPTLAVVPYDSSAAKAPLVTQTRGQSARSEAFRTLRTNLQFVDLDRPPRTVVVTSAVAEEGKTTTACNLAITLAQAGIRVALVEGDLRRPRVADYMGVEPSVGLTSVLIGRATLAQALQPWADPRLAVLASGPIPPNPAELLGSGHMIALLGELQGQADVVILDAPPLLPVTDAAILSRVTDGAVMVVRAGRTRRDQLAAAVASLAQVDARLLGTVLNMVPAKGPDGVGYGYGYGYAARTDHPQLAAAPPTVIPTPPKRGRRRVHV